MDTNEILKQLAAGLRGITIDYVLDDLKDKSTAELDVARCHFVRELEARRTPRPKTPTRQVEPEPTLAQLVIMELEDNEGEDGTADGDEGESVMDAPGLLEVDEDEDGEPAGEGG